MIERLKKRRLPTYIRNGDDDTSHQPTYLIYSKSVSFYGTESSETKELEGLKALLSIQKPVYTLEDCGFKSI